MPEKQEEHCRLCGNTNPSTDDDGYTCCCNARVCLQREFEIYGFDDIDTPVVACCFAVAEKKFEEKGIDIKGKSGMRTY